MSNEVEKLVFETIDEINDGLNPSEKIDKSVDTVLVGRGGQLDSLGLVQLIVSVEQKVNHIFNLSISMVDDKAFSQNYSPFRTIGTLVDFVAGKITDENNSDNRNK
jgi:acyl carrier protein